TAEAWVRTTDAGQDGLVVGQGGWLLRVAQHAGTLVAQWSLVGGSFCSIKTFAAVTPIADGNWHHLVGVFANGWARLYVDGAEEVSGPLGFCGSADEVSIGAAPDGSTPFTGDVDEVAVYAGGLTASRVAAHYTIGTNRAIVPGTSRYYLGNNNTLNLPATPQGTWDDTSQNTGAWMSPVKTFGSQAFISPTESVAVANWSVLGGVFETQALPAQTIAGTLNWVLSVQESAAAAHFNWHLHVWVAAGESSTVRGVLLDDYTEASGTNEWPTTQQGWGPNGGPLSLNAVTIADGDHVVVELGYVARNTDATICAGTLPYHSGLGTPDATVGDLDITHPSWFEFSNLAVFAPPTSTPTPSPAP
ncbi:MAG TPA: LamG domain-containing protein, partial [Candidatus Acidoferrales bacterium]|nr:LamG domain-containing protein [Candidatus Acidoferrales bacterium]